MVYRGRPSAGCANCRKAKKRCDLEVPACGRCQRLKKPCSGYRDTSSLQIQDETNAVVRKAEKHHASNKSNLLSLPQSIPGSGVLTPASTHSDSSSSSDGTIDMPDHEADIEEQVFISPFEVQAGSGAGIINAGVNLALAIKPRPDDVAVNFFYTSFATGHWNYLKNPHTSLMLDPCLNLAMKACGMAALANIQGAVVLGREYARAKYVEALGLLNAALRDPVRCKRDESLIAVAMMGFYENLTCDNQESIRSWKAHVQGATQLIKLRGKEQFKTQLGRLLFRETRGQVLIQCIWDDEKPPEFLREYQAALTAASDDILFVPFVDTLTDICFEFAYLRSKLRLRKIPDTAGVEEATRLEGRFIQWSMDAMEQGAMRYSEIEVPDSPHVWNGMVHGYACNPAPNIWNTWRCMRIMLSRTHEVIAHRLQFSDGERDSLVQYFHSIRRKMADDICRAIPAVLGHAGPTAFNSSCVLMTAYGSIWPLFFAGTCALERVSPGAMASKSAHFSSAPVAQATWILGRLDYITNDLGLRWADSIAATLRGDFWMYGNVLAAAEGEKIDPWQKRQRPAWIEKVENSHRGPRVLLEPENPHTDRLVRDQPIWIGMKPDETHFKDSSQCTNHDAYKTSTVIREAWSL